MPRRSDASVRVGLCSIVRARISAKLGNVFGPLTKSVIALALVPLTPGVTSTSDDTSGPAPGRAHRGRSSDPTERHADDPGPSGPAPRMRRRDVGGEDERAERRRPRTGRRSARARGDRRDQRTAERQRDGVPRVGVLGATVEQDELRRSLPHTSALSRRPSDSSTERPANRPAGRRTAGRTQRRCPGSTRIRRTRPARPSAVPSSVRGDRARWAGSGASRDPSAALRALADRRLGRDVIAVGRPGR